MMFGESLLIENSVDPFAAHGGAGSKLGRISELKQTNNEHEKVPKDPQIQQFQPQIVTKDPPQM
jgi:hypothetical protein